VQIGSKVNRIICPNSLVSCGFTTNVTLKKLIFQKSSAAKPPKQPIRAKPTRLQSRKPSFPTIFGHFRFLQLPCEIRFRCCKIAGENKVPSGERKCLEPKTQLESELTSRLFVPFILVVLIAGCVQPLTSGTSSRSESHGLFYTLNYSDSISHVGVAFVFQKRIDTFSTNGETGSNSLSMYDANWQVKRTVEFQESNGVDAIDISFNYDGLNSLLGFRGQAHALEVNEIAVVRFDERMNFELEIVSMDDSIVKEILKEMGQPPIEPQTQPTKTAQE